MFSEQSVLKDFAIGVQLVENGVGIGFVAGGKNDDFVLGSHFFEEGEGIGSNIDADVDEIAVDFDLEFHICLVFHVFIAMNQCFVQVQNQSFLIPVVLTLL